MSYCKVDETCLARTGLLVFTLGANWWLRIRQYRAKIIDALEGLASDDESSIDEYYRKQVHDFQNDWPLDYGIASVIAALAAWMVFA